MKYFRTEELVSESVYRERGERSMQLIDKHIPVFLDNLREALGRSITCNDWVFGGEYHWRGLRTKDSTDFSQYSQHTFGRAIDAKIKGMSAEDVRQWLIENRNLWWVKPVTFIESGESVTWLHIDLRGGTDGNLWVWDKDTGKTTIYQR